MELTELYGESSGEARYKLVELPPLKGGGVVLLAVLFALCA